MYSKILFKSIQIPESILKESELSPFFDFIEVQNDMVMISLREKVRILRNNQVELIELDSKKYPTLASITDVKNFVKIEQKGDHFNYYYNIEKCKEEVIKLSKYNRIGDEMEKPYSENHFQQVEKRNVEHKKTIEHCKTLIEKREKSLEDEKKLIKSMDRENEMYDDIIFKLKKENLIENA